MGKEHKQRIHKLNSMTNKDIKTCSTSPIIKDFQIETAIKYHFGRHTGKDKKEHEWPMLETVWIITVTHMHW